jgi:gliding motility-associated lipoprotein GldH
VQKQLQLAKNNYGWLGTAMDDIIEHRVLLNEKGPVKLKKGNYTFVLQQAMREDPLTGVINAGIRAEKVIQ